MLIWKNYMYHGKTSYLFLFDNFRYYTSIWENLQPIVENTFLLTKWLLLSYTHHCLMDIIGKVSFNPVKKTSIKVNRHAPLLETV